MRKSPFLGFALSIICMILIIGIYTIFSKKKEILIDNPTNSSIRIKLNNEEYILISHQYIKGKVVEGKNTLSIEFIDKDSIKVVRDTFFIINKLSEIGLINPTFSDYYLFRQYYDKLNNEQDSLYFSQSIIIDGKEYFGDIKKNHSIYIDDFDLNINENFPKFIKKENVIQSRKKLFRKNEFLQFYQSKFQ